jgi:AcrR family transcriptional regulator
MRKALHKPKTQELRESKNEFLRKAAVLFREGGYYGITVDDIAKKLNINKVHIYYLWRNKQDILYEIHLITHKALLDNLKQILEKDDPLEQKLRKAIISHINVVCAEMSPITAALQQEYALSRQYKRVIIKIRDEYDRLFRQLIKDGCSKGVFIDCDEKMISFAIIGAANYTQHWFSEKGPLPKEKVVELIADYLLHGLLKPVQGKEKTRPRKLLQPE